MWNKGSIFAHFDGNLNTDSFIELLEEHLLPERRILSAALSSSINTPSIGVGGRRPGSLNRGGTSSCYLHTHLASME